MIEIVGLIEEIFSPHAVWLEGICAHNQGKSRDSCNINHPKAILAFQRGWDRAQEAQTPA